jgi:hypothetical protein
MTGQLQGHYLFRSEIAFHWGPRGEAVGGRFRTEGNDGAGVPGPPGRLTGGQATTL